jgi:hypothetical protein
MFPPIASSWPPSEAAIQKNTDIPVFLLDGRVKLTAVRLVLRAIVSDRESISKLAHAVRWIPDKTREARLSGMTP